MQYHKHVLAKCQKEKQNKTERPGTCGYSLHQTCNSLIKFRYAENWKHTVLIRLMWSDIGSGRFWQKKWRLKTFLIETRCKRRRTVQSINNWGKTIQNQDRFHRVAKNWIRRRKLWVLLLSQVNTSVTSELFGSVEKLSTSLSGVHYQLLTFELRRSCVCF